MIGFLTSMMIAASLPPSQGGDIRNGDYRVIASFKTFESITEQLKTRLESKLDSKELMIFKNPQLALEDLEIRSALENLLLVWRAPLQANRFIQNSISNISDCEIQPAITSRLLDEWRSGAQSPIQILCDSHLLNDVRTPEEAEAKVIQAWIEATHLNLSVAQVRAWL